MSKTLAPALRLGWLVAPEHLVERLARAKAEDDLGTPVIDQLALADFLERGGLDRHLRRTRLTYRARRDALIARWHGTCPRCGPSGAAAGLHLVAHLPAGTDEPAVAEARPARAAWGLPGWPSTGCCAATARAAAGLRAHRRAGYRGRRA